MIKVDLSHQHYIVTGGTRGIGAAISRVLVKAGASVVANYCRHEESAQALKKELGNSLHLIKADLSGAMEVNRLFSESMDYFNGRIDGLVNNAGIAISSGLDKNILEWTDDWLRTMDVNLNAVGLLSMRTVKQFQQQESGGRIVTISSRAAHRGDTADYLAYASSKAGVVALTKSIARSFGKEGVKAFVVAPGFTQTEMAQQFIKQYGEEYAKHDIALDELTKPEDIAPTVAFLLSGMMDHATGTTIDINAASYVR